MIVPSRQPRSNRYSVRIPTEYTVLWLVSSISCFVHVACPVIEQSEAQASDRILFTVAMVFRA